jgi:hypothetical protein
MVGTCRRGECGLPAGGGPWGRRVWWLRLSAPALMRRFPRRKRAGRGGHWVSTDRFISACPSSGRGVCGVANPRHTSPYGCGLRLASSPARRRSHPGESISAHLAHSVSSDKVPAWWENACVFPHGLRALSSACQIRRQTRQPRGPRSALCGVWLDCAGACAGQSALVSSGITCQY